MQEIKKTRIVIASVLKPVDDTRMYEKMGLSLASTGKAEVHIIGYPSVRSSASKDIQFHPLKRFSRVSIRRITAAWSIAIQFIRLNPSVVIVTTHELLLAAVLTKFVRGSRVIYDVRENYYRNIVYTNAFPAFLRYFIAWHVRFKEIVTSMFVSHFILAERGYEIELGFPGIRKTVIENKLKRPGEIDQKTNRRAGSNFLFTGTLAESTGVFKAIELVTRLHMADSSVQLTIVGFAAQQDVRTKIRDAAKDKAYIKLVGIDALVPHADIIKAIQQADVGIIAYPLNKSTENSIPTKLFEYLGFTLPIAVVNHRQWVEICDLWDAAVVFDLEKFEASEFLSRLRAKEFYPKIPQNVFWEDEESALITIVLGQK